ncbi:MAG: hypothetical protein AVDCRST_MAG47-611, partial [uncultured Nocardioidaceae bacterium]
EQHRGPVSGHAGAAHAPGHPCRDAVPLGRCSRGARCPGGLEPGFGRRQCPGGRAGAAELDGLEGCLLRALPGLRPEHPVARRRAPGRRAHQARGRQRRQGLARRAAPARLGAGGGPHHRRLPL